MKALYTLILLCIFIVPASLHAEQQLTVSMNPTAPTPYSTVTITLTSYSFDVFNSMIVWNVDGKQFQKGTGIQSIRVSARGVGQSTNVSVQITTPEGDTLESSLVIIPQSIDLVWEALESYTPPFYEGKSLPGDDSSVRVTAIPSLSAQGVLIPAQNLSYSWYINDNLVESASGYGKSSAIFRLDYLNSTTDIKVNVRSKEGYSSEKTITIYPHTVMPILYPYDDILGINFNRPLTRRFETTQEVTLALSPYYLSTRGASGSHASYEWYLDGLPVTPQEKTFLSLRPQENSRGVRTLSIIVSNTKRILQKAESELTIIFDTRK